MPRSYFIHTFGCQMNASDSERMGEALARAGWEPTGSADSADLILLNTCSIREKAEHKLYSELGRYRMLKAQRGTRIGVAGCVAQQEKEKLLQRAPFVDFVVGPDHLTQVPALVESKGRVETDWIDSADYLFPQGDPETSRGRSTAFVTVMKGCDNVCSFCVVPYTRGREVSRPYAEVVREVGGLVDVGVREVTLIGQNVNSYSGGCAFAELIRRVAAVPGILRIRFTTSHPMDLSPDLVRCFADVPQLMPHFHLPVQHGADTVLQRMRRKYTIAEYERRIGELFAACPEVALTSDVICGFPGETEDEHALNLRFLERTPYDNLFSFLYSPRPHTGAILKLEEWGEIPRQVALRRLDEVQALQRARTLGRHRAAVGREIEVLVESVCGDDRFGRSRENWTVHFGGDARVGDVVRVKVASASLVALRGAQAGFVDRTPHVEARPRTRLSVVVA